MLDWFLILTPVFILGVIALLGFLGCDSFFGLNPVVLAVELEQIKPNFGASAGGTPVTLSGANFNGVYKVTFDGIPALFNTVDNVEIDAISPPHAVGAADVVIYAKQTDSGGNLVEDDSNPLPFTYVAIGFVQMQANLAPAGTSISVTLSNPATAGNFLIATVASGGAATVTVKDNSGNTFTSVGKHPWFQGQAEMFYLPRIPGGTVTVIATGATAPWNICVSEYTGGISLGPVGANHSSNAGSATISGVAVAPSPGNMVYVAVFITQPGGASPVPDLGFTGHSSPQDAAVLVEDTMNAVTSGQTVATVNTTQWVVMAAEIRA